MRTPAKSEEFIVSEISRIQDRVTMLTREYNSKGISLNERGVEKYQQAVEALRDAVNHLRIASVNTDKNNFKGYSVQ